MSSFAKMIEEMDGYLRELKNTPLFNLDESFPKEGVYVLYEEEKPLYAGRSRNINKRIYQHRRGDLISSSFAFLLAKEEAKVKELDIQKKRREDLRKDDGFKKIFFEQKKRIAKMKVKAVGIEDHFKQALFEIYASIQLKTKYNSFKTH